MAESKHRPKFKAKKKAANIKKQKQREMENIAKKQPVTYTYHKDAETVAVPIKAWQVLNQSAENLRNIATFVSVMEQIGNLHMTDGTLLPVYDEDLEVVPGSTVLPNGQVQKRIKEGFWTKGVSNLVGPTGEPVTAEDTEAPKIEVVPG